MTPDLQLGLWISSLVLLSGIILPPTLIWLADPVLRLAPRKP